MQSEATLLTSLSNVGCRSIVSSVASSFYDSFYRSVDIDVCGDDGGRLLHSFLRDHPHRGVALKSTKFTSPGKWLRLNSFCRQLVSCVTNATTRKNSKT